jgi:hypothetical protein
MNSQESLQLVISLYKRENEFTKQAYNLLSFLYKGLMNKKSSSSLSKKGLKNSSFENHLKILRREYLSRSDPDLGAERTD